MGASGNAKIDMEQLPGKKVVEVQSWGNTSLLSCLTVLFEFIFDVCTYSVDEQTKPDRSLRLKLAFSNKPFIFILVHQALFGDIDSQYDWKETSSMKMECC